MAENDEVVEKDVIEEKVKKVSLTNFIIFILSCIVLVLFVVQIAINTDDMTEARQPSKVEIQSEIETDEPTEESVEEDFDYKGTQRGTMITK